MFKNQYLISAKEMTDAYNLNKNIFNNLIVYYHPSLNVSIAQKSALSLLLLGYIIDPLGPAKTNDDITNELVNSCTTKEALFKRVQSLSGRYVLLYKDEKDFIALGDACCLRQLYYGFLEKGIVLTSSVKMFLDMTATHLEISNAKKEFIDSAQYKENEYAWFGEESIDNRLKKILPNHYLDILHAKVERISIATNELIGERDVLDYASEILRGSFDAIVRRYQVLQAVTAGGDSRVLLSASREFKDSIQYYVFDHWGANNEAKPDIWIPRKLSAKLDICLQVITPRRLRDKFLELYRKEHVFPRILKMTEEIQYHYEKYSDSKAVRICGFGGEIIRCRYGHTDSRVHKDMLRIFSGDAGKNAWVNNAIDSWWNSGQQYSQQYNISLLDLFYWEQKMGNWGSLYPSEQDIAIEEFCPFYHKNMILSIMRIDPKKRRLPTLYFTRSLMNRLWPDVLKEPINPTGLMGNIRKQMGKNSILRYYNSKLSSILR